jgi:hypothetical protein
MTPRSHLDIAIARAQLGQADEAISILTRLLQKPGDDCITTALLRADPVWIPLRNDPRFQKLIEGDKTRSVLSDYAAPDKGRKYPRILALGSRTQIWTCVFAIILAPG